MSAFQEKADSLYTLLKSKNAGNLVDKENGHSYGFLNISVGIYRERTPEDVQDMIEEAEEGGEPMETEDIEYEMRRATHWDTIGLGVKDYYT